MALREVFAMLALCCALSHACRCNPPNDVVSRATRPRGFYELHFVKYYNARSFNRHLRYCDTFIWWWKGSNCDHFFKIHISLSGGRGYNKIQTKVYNNQDVVTFRGRLNNKRRNPIRREFRRWPGSLNLQVKVLDEDGCNRSEDVDYFRTTVTNRADSLNRNHVIHGAYHGHHTYLQFRLKVVCRAPYFPPHCDRICRPQRHGRCRYTCGRHGERKCMPGCKNPAGGCCDSECRHGGKSVPSSRHGFRCVCRPGFTGRFCERRTVVYGT